jgi:hypothetical protein
MLGNICAGLPLLVNFIEETTRYGLAGCLEMPTRFLKGLETATSYQAYHILFDGDLV